jgi:protein TonB
MTKTHQSHAAALSANDAFKLQYPKYLRRSILAALALLALIVWLWPGYQPQPYKLRESQVFEIVQIAPPADVVVPSPPLAPVINKPIEAAPEGDPDIITDPVIPLWEPFTRTAPVTPNYDGFVASSANPRLIRQAKADYPEIARRSGLEGTVLVRVLVGPTGWVKEAVVAQGVHPVLDRAAVAAARKCRFEPARQREMKVKAWVEIPYRFKLR